VSWIALLALAAGTYGMKAIGPLLLGDRPPPPAWDAAIALVAVPLFAALVLVQTVTTEGAFVIDARLAAVGVAAMAIWRGAPFLVVVLLAAATGAAVHAVI
jgi:hypothetical protein